MYKALLLIEPPLSVAGVRQDLEAVGVRVVKEIFDSSTLAQEVVRLSPDLVVAFSLRPTTDLFKSSATLSTVAPCPFILFTSDSDSARIVEAADSGVHSYIVDGYAKHRIPSIIHIARARFRRDQILKEEYTGLSRRFEERTVVERAKGLLMRSRGIHETEAFELLRALAMHSRQRIGIVAQSVIDMSRAGEVLNRAGQLRMLSQRVVKCYAQALLGCDPISAKAALSDCVERVDANLRILEKAISVSGYIDLVTRVSADWQEFKLVASSPPDVARLAGLDDAAEKMLTNADNLTKFLESAGLISSLPIVNLAGKQRMYSQRILKLCCLFLITSRPAYSERVRELIGAVDESFDFLESAPLSTRAIQKHLSAATSDWGALKKMMSDGMSVQLLPGLVELGDSLLEKCEQLTDEYEKAVQIVVGNQIGRLPAPPRPV